MSLTDVSYCNDFLTIINTQEGIWNSDFQPRCSRISENIKWKVELLSLYVGHLPLRFFFNHLDFKPLALSILQKKILKFQLLIECCNNFDWSISVPNSIPFCQKWCQKYHLEKWKHSCYPKIGKKEAWFANIFLTTKKSACFILSLMIKVPLYCVHKNSGSGSLRFHDFHSSRKEPFVCLRKMPDHAYWAKVTKMPFFPITLITQFIFFCNDKKWLSQKIRIAFH